MTEKINKRFYTIFILVLLLPAFAAASSITLAWNANAETDLGGYKIYYGTSSRLYNHIIDVGNVLEYEIPDLTPGVNYYFSLTAYDVNGNESGYSTELSLTAVDEDAPEISLVQCQMVDLVRVVFNESVDQSSAELAGNYQIDQGIVVQRVELQSDQRTVYLYTTQHGNGTYQLTVSNVRDRATVPNAMTSTQVPYTWSGNDETPPEISNTVLLNYDLLEIIFSEPLDQTAAVDLANYTISPAVGINSATLDGTFTKVYLSTGAHTAGQTYTLTVNNVKDVTSPANTITANTQSQYSWQSADTTPPRLIAARAVSATSVTVEFSEPLDKTAAETIDNYTITPTVAVTGATLNPDGTIVTLSTGVHSGGGYTITVTNVGDDASPSNTISSAALDYEYTPPDNTPPQVVSCEVTSPQIIKITFNETMERTSAESEANYGVSGGIQVQNATLDISGKVVILETSNHSAGDYQIIINNVMDKADPPNAIAANTTVAYSYTPPDTEPPQLLDIVMHGADLIELVFDESLERTSSENISNYNIISGPTIQSASLVGTNLDRVYLQTTAHQPNQSYRISVHSIMDRATVPNVIPSDIEMEYTYQAEDVTPPRLTDAEVMGNTVVKLSFSEPLEQNSAQTETNYSFTPALAVLSATLDASRQIVFLATTPQQTSIDYTVSVTGVTDLASPANTIDSENSLVFSTPVIDQTPPSIMRAESHGDQTVEISFSEPLEAASAQNAGNYAIDQGVQVLSASLSQAGTEVFLETSAMPRGTYTVTVNNVRDQAAAPNTVAANTQTQFTFIPADNQRPKLVNALFVNQNAVELVFDEPLNRVSAEATENYAINKNIVIERAMLNYDGTQVLLQTSSHYPGTYTVTVNNIKDGSAAGNLILPNTSADYSYQQQDDKAPTIVSAVLQDQTHLIVTFSESMDQTTASDVSHYAINNGIQIENALLLTGQIQVILEASEHATGQYILTVDGVQDASDNKNEIAAYSQVQYGWNPPDTESPSLTGASIMGNTNVRLEFSEALDVQTAQSIDNYSIQPFVEIHNAVLDNTLKIVWLTTAAHDAGSYTVTAVNIADRAATPNTIGSNNRASYSYTPPDTVAPSLASVEMKSSSMALYLNFDEPLSRASAENINNYSISPHLEISNAYLHASHTTVMLETASHQANTSYEVTVSGLEDRAPNPNRMSAPQKLQYTYTPPDNTPPEMLSVKLQGTRYLEIVFSETLDKASAENRDNYRFDPNVEVINVTLDPTTLKKVNMETSDHMPGITYQISARNIKDRAQIPNTIEENHWIAYSLPTTGGSADQTAPAVARIDPKSYTALDVVFTEPVTKSSAEDARNYSITDGITVVSAELDSQQVRVHLKTTEHQDGKSYKIQVSNIEDLATNPNELTLSQPADYLMKSGIALCRVSKTSYTMGNFSLDNYCYYDRDYQFSQVPTCLNGSVQIVTANDDKADTTAGFLSFEISGDATLYVGFDNRIKSLPCWLADWKKTGEQIVNSRNDIYNIYSLEAEAGRIQLGGNCGGLDDNMYLVFIQPHLSTSLVANDLSRSGYRLERLGVGDSYYIDRDYTLASLPSFLEETVWVRTANDDKTAADDDFLSFSLLRRSTLYVAFDAMISSTPAWLEGWMKMEDEIVDSRGVRFSIYTREYESGEVELGGNDGGMDDNMYLVLINPAENNGGNDSQAGPATFNLAQNYPNPFNPETTIRFEIHKTGQVKLSVINLLGQTVKTLVDENISGGSVREVIWDGTDEKGTTVASGIYFYRLQQGAFTKTRRMILLK